ncbi:MAG TPA: hypothetical protein VJM33_17185 [Microthrixaceae bacterium]|nr:hypothetical protein [Microthrixaceae bacterium]
MTRPVAAHGISITPPRGWEVRIDLRREDPIVAPAAPRLPGETISRSGTMTPFAHLGSFALPARRSDYGAEAVERMKARDVFVALVEFDREAADTPMFARRGLPALRMTDFHPTAMQRPMPHMCGAQWFFTEQGRAFCLYVVLGSWVLRRSLVTTASRTVKGIRISPR